MFSRASRLLPGLFVAVISAGAAFLPGPAAAQVGSACGTNSSFGTANPTSTIQTLLNCSSGAWAAAPVQIGGTAATCNSTAAGTVQWTGTLLKYCDGSTWQTALSTGSGSGGVTGSGSAGYDAIWTSSTAIGTGLIYESGGNVGIGVINPSWPLSISSVATGTSGSIYGIAENYIANPASTSSAGDAAAQFTTNYTSTQNLTGSIYGAQGYANNNTAATINIAWGGYGEATNTSTGTISSGVGWGGTVWNQSTGTISAARGLNGQVTNAAGGSIGTSYELYLNTANSGTITNQYGVYQSTAASQNYFAGNVGIGTVASVQALQVNDSTRYRGITLNNGTNDTVELIGQASGNDDGALNLLNRGVAGVQVLASGNSYFNGGNVGIGTTGPQGLLDVANSGGGTIVSRDTGATPSVLRMVGSGGAAYIESGTSVTTGGSSAPLYFTNIDAINTWMAISSSGNVGIGTTNPASVLDVNDPATALPAGISIENTSNAVVSPRINFIDLSLGSPSTAPVWLIDNEADKFRVVREANSTTNGATKFSITNTGNIGIGTANPQIALDVYSTSSNQQMHVGAGNQRIEIGYDTTSNYARVQGELLGTGAEPLVLQPAGGNVGIGTASPNSTLDVNGAMMTECVTVSTLPAGKKGMRHCVTDATSCIFLGALTGGGSTFCPVVYNGSAWVGG